MSKTTGVSGPESGSSVEAKPITGNWKGQSTGTAFWISSGKFFFIILQHVLVDVILLKIIPILFFTI